MPESSRQVGQRQEQMACPMVATRGQKVRNCLDLRGGSAIEQQKSPFRNFLLESETLLDSYCYWIKKFLGIHGAERTELVTISPSYRTDNPCFPLKLLQNTCTFPDIFKASDGKPETRTPYFQSTKKRITVTH